MDMTPKVQATKIKNKQRWLHKTGKFLHRKINNIVKRQPIKKIFAKHIPAKRSISKIHKNLLIYWKKSNNLITEWIKNSHVMTHRRSWVQYEDFANYQLHFWGVIVCSGECTMEMLWCQILAMTFFFKLTSFPIYSEMLIIVMLWVFWHQCYLGFYPTALEIAEWSLPMPLLPI